MRRGRSVGVSPELEPLDVDSTESIDRQVYQAIRRALMSGTILPGARLSTRSIAAALGVSTSPVRDSFKRLDEAGALKSVAKSAFVVHDLSIDEYREMVALRKRLEGLMVREAVARISAEEIERVRWLLSRMQSSTDPKQILHHNFRLHFIIYRAAAMPYALSVVENMWLRVGPSWHRSKADPVTLKFHHLAQLVQALAARNPDAAEAALCSDIVANAEAMFGSAWNEAVSRRNNSAGQSAERSDPS